MLKTVRVKTPHARGVHFDEFWRRIPGNVECLGYPGKLAIDIWEHVIGIGMSRCPRNMDKQLWNKRHGYLLHYVRKGELLHVISGKPHRVNAGCVCLMDYGRIQRVRNEKRAADLWWVLLGGKNVPRLFSELDINRAPVFDQLNRGRIEALFRELWVLIGRKPPAYEARAHVALNAIFAELIASRAQPSKVPSLVPRRAQLSDKVRLAVLRFERMYHTQLDLKGTAAAVGMDTWHFARRFRREAGMAPIQYLNRYRVEQAKHLLKTTAKPVHQISPLVGISDPDYFARLFRKTTGETPRTFRRKKR